MATEAEIKEAISEVTYVKDPENSKGEILAVEETVLQHVKIVSEKLEDEGCLHSNRNNMVAEAEEVSEVKQIEEKLEIVNEENKDEVEAETKIHDDEKTNDVESKLMAESTEKEAESAENVLEADNDKLQYQISDLGHLAKPNDNKENAKHETISNKEFDKEDTSSGERDCLESSSLYLQVSAHKIGENKDISKSECDKQIDQAISDLGRKEDNINSEKTDFDNHKLVQEAAAYEEVSDKHEDVYQLTNNEDKDLLLENLKKDDIRVKESAEIDKVLNLYKDENCSTMEAENESDETTGVNFDKTVGENDCQLESSKLDEIIQEGLPKAGPIYNIYETSLITEEESAIEKIFQPLMDDSTVESHISEDATEVRRVDANESYTEETYRREEDMKPDDQESKVIEIVMKTEDNLHIIPALIEETEVENVQGKTGESSYEEYICIGFREGVSQDEYKGKQEVCRSLKTRNEIQTLSKSYDSSDMNGTNETDSFKEKEIADSNLEKVQLEDEQPENSPPVSLESSSIEIEAETEGATLSEETLKENDYDACIGAPSITEVENLLQEKEEEINGMEEKVKDAELITKSENFNADEASLETNMLDNNNIEVKAISEIENKEEQQVQTILQKTEPEDKPLEKENETYVEQEFCESSEVSEAIENESFKENQTAENNLEREKLEDPHVVTEYLEAETATENIYETEMEKQGMENNIKEGKDLESVVELENCNQTDRSIHNDGEAFSTKEVIKEGDVDTCLTVSSSIEFSEHIKAEEENKTDDEELKDVGSVTSKDDNLCDIPALVTQEIEGGEIHVDGELMNKLGKEETTNGTDEQAKDTGFVSQTDKEDSIKVEKKIQSAPEDITTEIRANSEDECKEKQETKVSSKNEDPENKKEPYDPRESSETNENEYFLEKEITEENLEKEKLEDQEHEKLPQMVPEDLETTTETGSIQNNATKNQGTEINNQRNFENLDDSVHSNAREAISSDNTIKEDIETISENECKGKTDVYASIQNQELENKPPTTYELYESSEASEMNETASFKHEETTEKNNSENEKVEEQELEKSHVIFENLKMTSETEKKHTETISEENFNKGQDLMVGESAIEIHSANLRKDIIKKNIVTADHSSNQMAEEEGVTNSTNEDVSLEHEEKKDKAPELESQNSIEASFDKNTEFASVIVNEKIYNTLDDSNIGVRADFENENKEQENVCLCLQNEELKDKPQEKENNMQMEPASSVANEASNPNEIEILKENETVEKGKFDVEFEFNEAIVTEVENLLQHKMEKEETVDDTSEVKNAELVSKTESINEEAVEEKLDVDFEFDEAIVAEVENLSQQKTEKEEATEDTNEAKNVELVSKLEMETRGSMPEGPIAIDEKISRILEDKSIEISPIMDFENKEAQDAHIELQEKKIQDEIQKYEMKTGKKSYESCDSTEVNENEVLKEKEIGQKDILESGKVTGTDIIHESETKKQDTENANEHNLQKGENMMPVHSTSDLEHENESADSILTTESEIGSEDTSKEQILDAFPEALSKSEVNEPIKDEMAENAEAEKGTDEEANNIVLASLDKNTQHALNFIEKKIHSFSENNDIDVKETLENDNKEEQEETPLGNANETQIEQNYYENNNEEDIHKYEDVHIESEVGFKTVVQSTDSKYVNEGSCLIKEALKEEIVNEKEAIKGTDKEAMVTGLISQTDTERECGISCVVSPYKGMQDNSIEEMGISENDNTELDISTKEEENETQKEQLSDASCDVNEINEKEGFKEKETAENDSEKEKLLEKSPIVVLQNLEIATETKYIPETETDKQGTETNNGEGFDKGEDMMLAESVVENQSNDLIHATLEAAIPSENAKDVDLVSQETMDDTLYVNEVSLDKSMQVIFDVVEEKNHCVEEEKSKEVIDMKENKEERDDSTSLQKGEPDKKPREINDEKQAEWISYELCNARETSEKEYFTEKVNAENDSEKDRLKDQEPEYISNLVPKDLEAIPESETDKQAQEYNDEKHFQNDEGTMLVQSAIRLEDDQKISMSAHVTDGASTSDKAKDAGFVSQTNENDSIEVEKKIQSEPEDIHTEIRACSENECQETKVSSKNEELGYKKEPYDPREASETNDNEYFIEREITEENSEKEKLEAQEHEKSFQMVPEDLETATETNSIQNDDTRKQGTEINNQRNFENIEALVHSIAGEAISSDSTIEEDIETDTENECKDKQEVHASIQNQDLEDKPLEKENKIQTMYELYESSKANEANECVSFNHKKTTEKSNSENEKLMEQELEKLLQVIHGNLEITSETKKTHTETISAENFNKGEDLMVEESKIEIHSANLHKDAIKEDNVTADDLSHQMTEEVGVTNSTDEEDKGTELESQKSVETSLNKNPQFASVIVNEKIDNTLDNNNIEVRDNLENEKRGKKGVDPSLQNEELEDKPREKENDMQTELASSVANEASNPNEIEILKEKEPADKQELDVEFDFEEAIMPKVENSSQQKPENEEAVEDTNEAKNAELVYNTESKNKIENLKEKETAEKEKMYVDFEFDEAVVAEVENFSQRRIEKEEAVDDTNEEDKNAGLVSKIETETMSSMPDAPIVIQEINRILEDNSIEINPILDLMNKESQNTDKELQEEETQDGLQNKDYEMQTGKKSHESCDPTENAKDADLASQMEIETMYHTLYANEISPDKNMQDAVDVAEEKNHYVEDEKSKEVIAMKENKEERDDSTREINDEEQAKHISYALCNVHETNEKECFTEKVIAENDSEKYSLKGQELEYISNLVLKDLEVTPESETEKQAQEYNAEKHFQNDEGVMLVVSAIRLEDGNEISMSSHDADGASPSEEGKDAELASQINRETMNDEALNRYVDPLDKNVHDKSLTFDEKIHSTAEGNSVEVKKMLEDKNKEHELNIENKNYEIKMEQNSHISSEATETYKSESSNKRDITLIESAIESLSDTQIEQPIQISEVATLGEENSMQKVQIDGEAKVEVCSELIKGSKDIKLEGSQLQKKDVEHEIDEINKQSESTGKLELENIEKNINISKKDSIEPANNDHFEENEALATDIVSVDGVKEIVIGQPSEQDIIMIDSSENQIASTIISLSEETEREAAENFSKISDYWPGQYNEETSNVNKIENEELGENIDSSIQVAEDNKNSDEQLLQEPKPNQPEVSTETDQPLDTKASPKVEVDNLQEENLPVSKFLMKHILKEECDLLKISYDEENADLTHKEPEGDKQNNIVISKQDEISVPMSAVEQTKHTSMVEDNVSFGEKLKESNESFQVEEKWDVKNNSEFTGDKKVEFTTELPTIAVDIAMKKEHEYVTIIQNETEKQNDSNSLRQEDMLVPISNVQILEEKGKLEHDEALENLQNSYGSAQVEESYDVNNDSETAVVKDETEKDEVGTELSEKSIQIDADESIELISTETRVPEIKVDDEQCKESNLELDEKIQESALDDAITKTNILQKEKGKEIISEGLEETALGITTKVEHTEENQTQILKDFTGEDMKLSGSGKEEQTNLVVESEKVLEESSLELDLDEEKFEKEKEDETEQHKFQASTLYGHKLSEEVKQEQSSEYQNILDQNQVQMEEKDLTGEQWLSESQKAQEIKLVKDKRDENDENELEETHKKEEDKLSESQKFQQTSLAAECENVLEDENSKINEDRVKEDKIEQNKIKTSPYYDGKLSEEVKQVESSEKKQDMLDHNQVDMKNDLTEGQQISESQKAKECKVDEDKTDDEREEEDEHKEDEYHHDETINVENRDANVTPTKKKSHGILSGVGSKVKRSIIKVKKAITGKSSHSEAQSTK